MILIKPFLLKDLKAHSIDYDCILSTLQYTNPLLFWLAFIFVIVDFLYTFVGNFCRFVDIEQNVISIL